MPAEGPQEAVEGGCACCLTSIPLPRKVSVSKLSLTWLPISSFLGTDGFWAILLISAMY